MALCRHPKGWSLAEIERPNNLFYSKIIHFSSFSIEPAIIIIDNMFKFLPEELRFHLLPPARNFVPPYLPTIEHKQPQNTTVPFKTSGYNAP